MEDRLVNHVTLNNRWVLKFCRERKRYPHSKQFYYDIHVVYNKLLLEQ